MNKCTVKNGVFKLLVTLLSNGEEKEEREKIEEEGEIAQLQAGRI